MRTFEDSPAVLGEVPLIIGLTGYSNSGKTFSALRLATGIQKVRGGDIYGIDTESGRMRQYADRFKFRHVPFAAPYGPLDYLAAINHCASKGARIIVVDQMTHEHDGEGGVLDQSEKYLDAKAGDNWKERAKYQQLSWQAPKAARKQLNRRIVSELAGEGVTFILCYRGQDKMKMVRGEEPIQLGTQAITTSNLVYDMTARFLFRPGADGVPTTVPDTKAEAMMLKSIETFRAWPEMTKQVSEALGERLAKWAAGTVKPEAPKFSAQYPDKQWAGKSMAGAPASAVLAYIAALEARGREIPADVQVHYDNLIAGEMDRARDTKNTEKNDELSGSTGTE